MAKSHLKLVSPRTLNRTVRPKNSELRTREYLTEPEVERLIKAARANPSSLPESCRRPNLFDQDQGYFLPPVVILAAEPSIKLTVIQPCNGHGTSD